VAVTGNHVGEHALRVTSTSKVYLMCAKDEDELEDWLKDLYEARQFAIKVRMGHDEYTDYEREANQAGVAAMKKKELKKEMMMRDMARARRSGLSQ